MLEMTATREQQIEQALFRGGSLTLENPEYLEAVRTFTDALLRTDLRPGDLTVEALGFESRQASAAIVARESGVVAGLAELAFMLQGFGVSVRLEKRDGDPIEWGDVLLRAEGDRTQLLSLERVGLNVVQRLSGIATATRCLAARVCSKAPGTRVVATRKTLWGLLDKRAVHLGRGGTHRLGLGDAILIKNNHLALIASREEEAAPIAISRAWSFRRQAAFIEAEVRSESAALAAARAFRRLQVESAEEYPCLLLLDNLMPEEIGRILTMLRRENLWDATLIEASGGISERNAEAYAVSGVDAISVGALTHSTRALDICQRIS
ncbi:MAG TPA: carboxylating nicotinate-nucleotide diphosphorylase [Bryobacteraceae bacterium]|jgi:nicotinate-nucleotide pyrophosphorylase (carboxylating)|nr:carboxylating nicotinate-nucleotide diphosphorylase [Bryobacteraceae bacterium]